MPAEWCSDHETVQSPSTRFCKGVLANLKFIELSKNLLLEPAERWRAFRVKEMARTAPVIIGRAEPTDGRSKLLGRFKELHPIGLQFGVIHCEPDLRGLSASKQVINVPVGFGRRFQMMPNARLEPARPMSAADVNIISRRNFVDAQTADFQPPGLRYAGDQHIRSFGIGHHHRCLSTPPPGWVTTMAGYFLPSSKLSGKLMRTDMVMPALFMFLKLIFSSWYSCPLV